MVLLYCLMMDQALLKALLCFWEKAVWAGEAISDAFAIYHLSIVGWSSGVSFVKAMKLNSF